MQNIHVRQATLDDTAAISLLFRSRIVNWQRLDSSGHVQDVPYEALSVYERWLHGGPWMSVETGAIHLGHVLRRAGKPLVAVCDDQVIAYSELYHSIEPPPFGENLNLTHPLVHPEHENQGVEMAMLLYTVEEGQKRKCQRLTANLALHEDRTPYTQRGFKPLMTIRRYQLSARTGQGFYRVSDHLNDNPAQIENWYMPVGRLTSARQQWETLWPRTWDALPETHQQQTHRLAFIAAGQTALLFGEQQLYAPRMVTVYCWSPKPLTVQLLTAIRDWAHQSGYRTLVLAVPEHEVKLMGPDIETDPYYHEVLTLDL
ncbi:MAG: GNAT family N-acetyltransferase [Anaerolineae bacterium]|nr:GNAT family N-acetyltransferase [Anaerolineae bacterium]